MELWDLAVTFFDLLWDFVTRVDVYLYIFVDQYGLWIYALLFAVIFVETGFVVMPFLPGDSMLFVVGTLAGAGMIDFSLATGLMFVAAVAGDQCNYTIGRWFGPKVFQWEGSKFFNRKAFDTAHQFYEKHGGITIVIARFMPFVRTFVPFVAGVAQMQRIKFVLFNVVGAALWIFGVTALGYFFGGFDIVKDNFEKVIWALILIPGGLAVIGGWRASRKGKVTPAA